MTTMDYRTTVRAVKALKVERGSLSCLGCGYEDNCTLHGCAILRNAADHMEAALANHDHLTALLDQTEAALNAATVRAEEAEREIERLKKIMRDEGIVVIPSKHPGCKSEWNLPRRGKEE